MKGDAKREALIRKMRDQCDEFLRFISDLNQCAYTDGMVENILKTAEELKKLDCK